MFHVELRQFPSLARAFNLTREELDRRLVISWVSGQPVELNERRWSPVKARLTIYEAPQLRPDEIGVGRGWPNVARAGEDVTARVLADARAAGSADGAVEQFKHDVAELAMAGELALHDVLGLATERHPSWRLSDRLALAERAVWELLHERRVMIMRGYEAIRAEQWEPVLLSSSTWSGSDPVALRAEVPATEPRS